MTIDRQPWPLCRLQAVVGPMPGARGCIANHQYFSHQSLALMTDADVPPRCVYIWASGPHARPHACMQYCAMRSASDQLLELHWQRRRRGEEEEAEVAASGRFVPAPAVDVTSSCQLLAAFTRTQYSPPCLWHTAPTSRYSHAYARAQKASSCGWGAFSPLRRHLQITDGNAARAWASTHRASGEWRVALVSQLRSSLCKMAMTAPICMARASGAAIRRRGRDRDP